MGYFGCRSRFQKKCNQDSKLGYFGCRSRFHKICNQDSKNDTKTGGAGGRRPPAPLFSSPIWNLGYNFCGISTGSQNSPIWNLGYNFSGISTGSPNSPIWSLGYNFSGIELCSIKPPVSHPGPILALQWSPNT